MTSNAFRPLRASRQAALAVAIAVSVAVIAPAATASNSPESAHSAASVQVRASQFQNNGIAMAANLFLPPNYVEGKKYPAIVVSHPGGGVKEQTAGLYAKKLAEQGFIALTFDASHQGASGGLPRFLDDPMKRVSDIYSAVDYLTTLNSVDAARIGALGICAGSGSTVKAAMTERRIKAVGTVSAVDVGAAVRRGWDGRATVAQQLATLEAVAQQRTAEAAGAAPVYVPYVPAVGDKTAPKDLQEAADYYLTARGQHPNAPNKMLLTSAAYAVSFDGFGGADALLTQPLLMIAGSEAGSLWHSQELVAKAAGPKELYVVEGATHMTLYDDPGQVAQASKKLAAFFNQSL